MTAESKKYDERTVALCKAAQQIRGRKNAIANVTVTRVAAAMEAASKTADQVVKSFKTVKDAGLYAKGDKAVKAPTLVVELSREIDDPFARGRGLVAVALAMREVRSSE
jgi:hypothetical protein